MTDAGKKEREKWIIETARKYCALIPTGDLVPHERPDWLIPSAFLGIEVSELLPLKSKRAKFSGPQLSTFQEDVVSLAERVYYSNCQAHSADVLVFFENEWQRKRDPKKMGQALAKFVADNYPSGSEDCVTLQAVTRGVRNWVEGVSVVRVLRAQGRWQAGGSSGIERLSYQELAACIAGKDALLSEYRRRCPGYQIWLLLSTRISVLHSVSIPHDVREWRFNSGFDKIILSSWEDGVSELRRENWPQK